MTRLRLPYFSPRAFQASIAVVLGAGLVISASLVVPRLLAAPAPRVAVPKTDGDENDPRGGRFGTHVAWRSFDLEEGEIVPGKLNLVIHAKLWHGPGYELTPGGDKVRARVEIYDPADTGRRNAPIAVLDSADVTPTPGELYVEDIPFSLDLEPSMLPYPMTVSLVSTGGPALQYHARERRFYTVPFPAR